MDSRDQLRPARIIGLLALGGLGIGCLLVLRPFLSALVWAAILAYTTWPLFLVLRDRLKLPAGAAALVMVIAEFLLIGLPLVFAAPTGSQDVQGLRNLGERLVTEGIPATFAFLGSIPYVGEFLSSWLGGLDATVTGLLDLARPYAGTLAQYAWAAVLAVLSGIAELLLAIVLAFFFYRDGPAMARRAHDIMEKLAGDKGRRMLGLTADVTRGVVYGLLGTAVAQGVLAGLGFWIAGVPQPLLLGVITGVISVLPVGAPVIWIPAAIWLFVEGSWGWGLFMGLYGGLVVSSVDNIIRPWLISRGADLPLLLTLLGAIGGVLAFGILGLFLGPVLLAVGYTLIKDWAEDGARREGGADPG
jgi:predicted PurR-regulated permease PerM